MDSPYPQHEGRLVHDPYLRQRCRHETCRQQLYLHIPAAGTVLGRAAWNIRPCICRRICHHALHSRHGDRQGACQMGTDSSDSALHTSLMGQELHADDRFLHRLYPYVCQVPHSGLDTCHSRVHHTSSCHPGAEEACRGAR